MKLLRVFVAVALLFSVSLAQNKKETKAEPKTKTESKAKDEVALKTQTDSISYAIGQNICMQLKSLELNMDIISKSIKDGAESKSALTQDKIMAVLTAFQTKMQEKQAAAAKEQEEAKKAASAKNKAEGEKFLAENKTKEGVQVTASGLQYKVLAKGTGTVSPKDTNTVKVHYVGTLLDGTEFDSSVKRGQPAEFPLNQVIKGWTEGVQLMHVGDRYQFFIPSELAYGDNGAGQLIGAGATLIFEVELLEIVK
jgi:FKBP-type peptidyl-prolyl cis-trans isomerase FkpA